MEKDLTPSAEPWALLQTLPGLQWGLGLPPSLRGWSSRACSVLPCSPHTAMRPVCSFSILKTGKLRPREVTAGGQRT